MANPLASPTLAAALCVAMPASAGARHSYVFCDNGLRCVKAPCPSNSALDLATGGIIKGISIDTRRLPQADKTPDLSDALYAGTVVVRGSIEKRTKTIGGDAYTSPWLVASAIERHARDSERGHCSSR